MPSSEYRLDFAAPRRRHDEPRKYIIYVLWLIGYSLQAIAEALGMRRNQVNGIIKRSEYAGRSTMADRDRRHFLDELRAVRYEDGKPIDGGKLDFLSWDIMPLGRKAG